MGIESSIVFVLLINEEAGRILFVPMYLIHEASRFFARGLGELAKKFGHLGLVARFSLPCDSEDDHQLAFDLAFFSCARKVAANSGMKMVCSRSGPVETIPMRAPVSFSMN